METLYIKLKILKSDVETEKIRNAGLFFINIADAAGLDRDAVEEIDESNYASIINEIQHRHSQ